MNYHKTLSELIQTVINSDNSSKYPTAQQMQDEANSVEYGKKIGDGWMKEATGDENIDFLKDLTQNNE